MIRRPWAVSLTAIVLSAAIWAAAFASDSAPPSYRLAGSIPLGPGERWDYVTFDPASNRAFVAHGDHVTVVDTVQARVVGQMVRAHARTSDPVSCHWFGEVGPIG